MSHARRKRWIGNALCLAALAAGATSSMAADAALSTGVERVYISTSEARAVEGLTDTLSLDPKHKQLTVRTGSRIYTYGEAAAFVRDLSPGTRTAYQMGITCDGDSILLGAFGIAPERDHHHLSYRSLKVRFSKTGALLEYEGVVPESYDVISDHFR